MAKFTPELQTEYEHLFASCRIAPEHLNDVLKTLDKILCGKIRYMAVTAVSEVPWYVIGLLHSMESGCSFTTHLHNGDPLSARTVHVPKGRPLIWNPPNDWESSAYDSLRYQGFVDLKDWSLARVLYRLEAYNGFGYRAHGIFSPYLWSYSQHYTKGKYVMDGVWNADAVSRQCGAAVMLKKMVDDGAVAYPGALPGYRDAGASQPKET